MISSPPIFLVVEVEGIVDLNPVLTFKTEVLSSHGWFSVTIFSLWSYVIWLVALVPEVVETRFTDVGGRACVPC